MSTKMVIVVRKDLNMRKGKMIAQGAHAAVTVLWTLQSDCDPRSTKFFQEWFASGQKKIAVSVDSEAELGTIYQKAVDKGIPASLVTDAGHTEFKGVPTKTAVAIGPWDEKELDDITRHLKLL